MTSLNKNNKKVIDSVDEEEDDDGNINQIIFAFLISCRFEYFL
jgi:hypothetical protein